MSSCFDVFLACVEAMHSGILIQKAAAQDKEFHFQDWFEARLEEAELNFDQPGRNSYPDYRLVNHPEGYELKALAWPGREKDYDCNSQVPSGLHNGRKIFYVFGRYPKDIKNVDSYPVVDLVICDGDFINADHGYVHKNKNIKEFGTYGDIMIRDRKMYVAPTPFALTYGTSGAQTLIISENLKLDPRFEMVGELERREVNEIVTGYSFDLEINEMLSTKKVNQNKNRVHKFIACRPKSMKQQRVYMN